MPSDCSKKRRTDSVENAGESSAGNQVNDDAENETEDGENGWEDDPNYSNYNNQEEEYNYDDDDGLF